MASERIEQEAKESSESSVKSRTVDKKVETKQWVTFSVNNESFAIEALQVREALTYSEITPVPGSNAFICGLINLRGKVITVIDMRLMFGLPYKAPNDDTNIVLVDFNEEELVGFVVDDVQEVINLPTKSIEIAPKASEGDAKSGFIKGVTFYNKKMIIILDIEKIIYYLAPNSEDAL